MFRLRRRKRPNIELRWDRIEGGEWEHGENHKNIANELGSLTERLRKNDRRMKREYVIIIIIIIIKTCAVEERGEKINKLYI